MKTGKIIKSSVVATSCMTTFSYLTSALKRKNFSEPELLAGIVSCVSGIRPRRTADLTKGWLLHYMFGAAWSPIQYFFHRKRRSKTGNKDAFVFGAVGGMVAVLAWSSMMKAARYTPQVRKRDFYGHLLAAHLVYSLAQWQMMKSEFNDQPGQTPRPSLPRIEPVGNP